MLFSEIAPFCDTSLWQAGLAFLKMPSTNSFPVQFPMPPKATPSYSPSMVGPPMLHQKAKHMTNDKRLTITPAERDIILAALRLYQHAHDRTERGVPDA